MGYDDNALYLNALSMDLPTQIALIRQEENEFKKEFSGNSEGCWDYLDCTAHDRNIKIQSALHGSGEEKIGNYKVDGFCKENNTVFEFYGDYWHAHPDLFPNENAQHSFRKHDDKDKALFTMKKSETMIGNIYSIYRTDATMLKSSGRHLLRIVPKTKLIFQNFVPLLTLKRPSLKIKLFNTSKMDIYLDLSNVTFTHLNTSRIAFQK